MRKLLENQLFKSQNFDYQEDSSLAQNISQMKCEIFEKKIERSNIQRGECKQNFSKEEDQLLRKLVQVYEGQTQMWKKIAYQMNQFIPNFQREPRKLRERWINKLTSQVGDKWSTHEDIKLIRLVIRYGKKWAKIQQQFNGRRAINLRNHFNSLIKNFIKLNSDKKHQEFEINQLTSTEEEQIFSQLLTSLKQNFEKNHYERIDHPIEHIELIESISPSFDNEVQKQLNCKFKKQSLTKPENFSQQLTLNRKSQSVEPQIKLNINDILKNYFELNDDLNKLKSFYKFQNLYDPSTHQVQQIPQQKDRMFPQNLNNQQNSETNSTNPSNGDNN